MHAPPENFEIISSVMRGKNLFKMFTKSIVIFMLNFICMTLRNSIQFHFIFRVVLKVF